VLRFGGGDGGLEAAAEDPLLSAQRRGVGPVLQAFAFEVGAQERGVGIEVPFVDVGARGVVDGHERLGEGGPPTTQGVEDAEGRVSMESANFELHRVTLSRSLVNCSLVLPWYFWMVTRSSSYRSSRCSSIGANRSPSSRKSPQIDDRFASSETFSSESSGLSKTR